MRISLLRSSVIGCPLVQSWLKDGGDLGVDFPKRTHLSSALLHFIISMCLSPSVQSGPRDHTGAKRGPGIFEHFTDRGCLQRSSVIANACSAALLCRLWRREVKTIPMFHLQDTSLFRSLGSRASWLRIGSSVHVGDSWSENVRAERARPILRSIRIPPDACRP